MTCWRGHFFVCFIFLPVFHPLIINPCLVIFKSVSTAKLSVLTPSSLAALQILPVSHLFCLLFNHVEQQPVALPRQSVSMRLISFPSLSSTFTFSARGRRMKVTGLAPFFSPASAHLFLRRLRSEQQGEWVFNWDRKQGRISLHFTAMICCINATQRKW